MRRGTDRRDVLEMMEGRVRALWPHLDERQRRLLAGAEACALGHGGIRAVARAAGMAETTVKAGVVEVGAGAQPLGRVRRPGGGRKRLAEADPGLLPALLALVEPEEIGDPVSPLRWTTKSLQRLSDELTAQGHPASTGTIAALLHEQGFSLQSNARTLAGASHADRDAQFGYLAGQVTQHQDAGQPVVSVDAKKKERIGNHANPGRTWRPKGTPVRVADHDFGDRGARRGDAAHEDTPGQDTPGQDTPGQDTPGQDTQGQDTPGGTAPAPVAIPYGIYDLARDSGWVNVGVDHNTAEFAVASIRRWWMAAGRHDYPHATRLLITADAGGGNAATSRIFKAHLAALAAETGLDITVCHFPPGTSKWNKIEHRLFSQITMNWRGRPLTSHEVAVQSIGATTTRTGLRVHAELDPGRYDLGLTLTDAQLAALPITRHDWHGEWNYTLHPTTSSGEATSSGAGEVAPAGAGPPPAQTRRKRPDPADPAWLRHPRLTGVTAEEFTALTTILAALEADQPTRSGPPLVLPLTARLTAALVNARTGLPRRDLAILHGVHYAALRVPHTLTTLKKINRMPRHGPIWLASLDDLYEIAELENIPHPPRRVTS